MTARVSGPLQSFVDAMDGVVLRELYRPADYLVSKVRNSDSSSLTGSRVHNSIAIPLWRSFELQRRRKKKGKNHSIPQRRMSRTDYESHAADGTCPRSGWGG
ncbi:hypothetical protein CI238_08734 [Colletotrichum incanum]|uniref:Uncharacterized protein n=1 Tax=Colletotrichum incanum TaxID=1573173 RepID=A0A162Q109_COLIC|nr:hypothetical protein CI238_08734 [Colletotrichum incanum]